ncbi:hypothetical protein QYZ87_05685 [Porphyromonadaceae bacterium W3.11]|nr:hypothetical protein [Porphyromonadaceae bacterium W3.11]
MLRCISIKWHNGTAYYIRMVVACTVMLFGFLSCMPHHDYYAYYEEIDKDGWKQSDELFFSVPTLSTKTDYTVSVALRLDRSIRYQEIPIGLVIEAPDRSINTQIVKISTTMDKVHTGGYNFIEKTYPLSTSIRYDEDGIYSYSIRHLSTDSILKGIIEVGIIIEPTSK